MRLAILGTGLMGRPMAERFLTGGHALTAYNRTRGKAEVLRGFGAQVADTPAAALHAAECVVLMLADAPAIRATLLSADCRAELRGRAVIQMGTIGASESRTLARDVSTAGGDYLEAPVLGSIPEVKAGKLLVFIGGTREQAARWTPLLRCLGPEPLHVGPIGHAAILKLALNQLIAALNAAFALSLGLVRRGGVDVETFIRVLRQSALHAPTFDKKLPRLLERNYAEPHFPTKHMLKDVALVLREAQTLGLVTPALEGVRRLFEIAVAQGLADADYSAVSDAIDPPERGPARA